LRDEHVARVYTCLALLWSLGGIALIWMAASTIHALLLARAVRQAISEELPPPMSPATVFLPCKGVDKALDATLLGLARQDHPDYDVICAVESVEDPAYAFILDFAQRHPEMKLRCEVAQESPQRCSQKICNLRAALAVARPETRALAFLDSDAVPPPHWLRAMTGLLHDPTVGAVTGFRWYVPGETWVGLARCAWNNIALSLLGVPRANFCWGGSMALRRETFERLQIAQRWTRVLSEDYEVTRSVREARLQLRFCPHALLPNDDRSTWPAFWDFARRQIIITRICEPVFWIVAASVAVLFTVAFWGLVAAGTVLLVTGPAGLAGWTFALAGLIYALSAVRGWARHRAVLWMLPPGTRTGAVEALAEIAGGPLLSALNTALVVATGASNRFWWRGVRYEMRRIDDVRVLERRPVGGE
jgi:cellulose synthase/poly-beta-1,6-N-acetylglucosamine synthase-like glycosyltransferase